MKPEAHIGASGWNYGDWRGRFYPERLPASKWLAYYASRFDTVEVNNTFYRKPAREVAARWVGAAPVGFHFAIKMWRGITHYRKLKNCAEFLEGFLDLVDVIPRNRRAPMLVQLPANFPADAARLAEFLGDWRAVVSGAPARRWPLAFEFRNDSWYAPETYRLLNRHRAALCIHDMVGRGAVSQPNDAAFVYMRRHGPGARYAGNYPAPAIARDAAAIAGWLAESRKVWVYFNNDVGGCAVKNAAELIEALAAITPEARARGEGSPRRTRRVPHAASVPLRSRSA